MGMNQQGSSDVDHCFVTVAWPRKAAHSNFELHVHIFVEIFNHACPGPSTLHHVMLSLHGACCCLQMVMLKRTKGLTWPFWALSLATTLVYLAGLAALQYSCRYIPTVTAAPGIFGRSVFGKFHALLWL